MSAKSLLVLMMVITAIHKVMTDTETEIENEDSAKDYLNRLKSSVSGNPTNALQFTGPTIQPVTVSREEFCKQLGGNLKDWDEKSSGIGKNLACMDLSIGSVYGQEISCPLPKEQRAILERAVKECPKSETLQRILDHVTDGVGDVIKALFSLNFSLLLTLLLL